MKRFSKILSIVMVSVLLLPLLAAPAAAQTAQDPLSYFIYLNQTTNELHLLVVNATGRTVDLTYPTGKDFDIVIRQADKTVWRASEGQVYTQAVRLEQLGSGAMKLYRVAMPTLPDGKYEVLGYFEGGASRGTAVAKMQLTLGNNLSALAFQLVHEKDKNALKLVVANTGKDPVKLTFNGGKQFDFVILDKAGNKVWQHSDGKFYTLAITEETLGAGQSKVYQAEMPKLAAGEYTVKAYFLGAPIADAVASSRIVVESPSTKPHLRFKAWYSGRKQPQIGFMVQNTSDQTLKLEFPTSQVFDIVIKGSNGYSWRYSTGKTFTQAVQVREVKPGATRYTFVYLPRLPKGSYTAEIYYMGVSAQKPVATTAFTVK